MSESLSFFCAVAANTNYCTIHVSVSLCQLSCQSQEWQLLGKGQEEQVKRAESIPATDFLVKLSEVFNTNGSKLLTFKTDPNSR